jgi:phosphohistidine phosphatase
MKTLLLLRHAKSSRDDPLLDDHDRPLNARGLAACRLLAGHARRARIRPDLALVSSSARTRATFDLMFPDPDTRPRLKVESALYLADEAALMDRIHRLPARVSTVLLIAHNPAMHNLAMSLIGVGNAELRTRLRRKYPTGALASFDFPVDRWRDVGAGDGRLTAFVRPRDL